jgi:hypothetical protein
MKLKLFIILSFVSFSFFGQTNEQAKQFFNKTNMAIYKCQKEILRANNSSENETYRELLKLQLEAKNYFTQANFKMALAFSNEAKQKSLLILTKLNPNSISYFENTKEESDLIKQLSIQALPNLSLSNEEITKVNAIDIKNPQATYSLIPTIN